MATSVADIHRMLEAQPDPKNTKDDNELHSLLMILIAYVVSAFFPIAQVIPLGIQDMLGDFVIKGILLIIVYLAAKYIKKGKHW